MLALIEQLLRRWRIVLDVRFVENEPAPQLDQHRYVALPTPADMNWTEQASDLDELEPRIELEMGKLD